MHFCEMRATPHLTNEYEIESRNENRNKTEENESEIKRQRNRNKNNKRNVAPATSQQQLKIRSDSCSGRGSGGAGAEMRHSTPLSGTVGMLQLPLLLLLCAGLNGLTHVAALKGKLQLHLPPLADAPDLPPSIGKYAGNMINNFRAALVA